MYIKSYVDTNKERLLLSLGMDSHTMWITWILAFPVYVRFTKLVLIVRVTTYDLRQVTSPIAEVKRYRIVYSISRKLITLK